MGVKIAENIILGFNPGGRIFEVLITEASSTLRSFGEWALFWDHFHTTNAIARSRVSEFASTEGRLDRQQFLRDFIFKSNG